MANHAQPAPTGSEDWRIELRNLKTKMDRNAHGHISQALRLKLLNDIATFITTIGGAGAMALSAYLIASGATITVVPIGLAALSSTITLVGVWQAVWQPGPRSDRHKQWASAFGAIEDECRLVDCGQSDTTLSALVARSLEITATADLVPGHLWHRPRARARQQATRLAEQTARD